MMKTNLLTGFVCIMLLLLLCVSAAYAEDAEQNLAQYGLNPQDILLEKIKFLPDENAIRYPFSREERPFYLWFDVTGDGCVDLCTERMFGSGMVRIQLSVYDPLNQKTYILDGYDHYFLLDSITDGRIIINKKGPYGYGEPVTVTRGTVILAICSIRHRQPFPRMKLSGLLATMSGKTRTLNTTMKPPSVTL